MFAIFLHEGMDPFYHNITSFPTVIFTVILGVCILFWMLAVLGLLDIDMFEVDVDIDDVDAGPVGGILVKFGLNGVPITIIITLITLFGWLLSYVFVAFLNPLIPGRALEILAGIPIFIVSLYLAAMVTAVVIKPLRKLFKKMEATSVKHVLGQIAVVRSSRVDNDFGEAIMKDGGADLLFRVRTRGDETFEKGDNVVLLEHDKATGLYYVISEKEFTS